MARLNNLCDSCTNFECGFQSDIIRTKCDFYKPPVEFVEKNGEAEWIDDKCSTCGKGIEDLIDSPEWYRNEEPNFCPFCGKKFKEKR